MKTENVCVQRKWETKELWIVVAYAEEGEKENLLFIERNMQFAGKQMLFSPTVANKKLQPANSNNNNKEMSKVQKMRQIHNKNIE